MGAGAEGAVGAPNTTSGIEADVVDTVPKTMQGKARRLMERLKRNMSWTSRGELIHEGVPFVVSNVVDLVDDLQQIIHEIHHACVFHVSFCKRKTDPTGCQPFARQLRAMKLPMELVGNVTRRDYIRQATTSAMTSTPGRRRRIPTTPCSGGSARRSLSWTPLARRRNQMEHSMLTPPPERQRKALASLARWEDNEDGATRVHGTVCATMSSDPQDTTYRSVIVAAVCSGLYLIADAIARSLIQQSLFRLWFQYLIIDHSSSSWVW